MKLLPGKVAVITGAASGIGEALAIALDGEGMQLVLVDVESLENLSSRLQCDPLVYEVDVSDEAAMLKLGKAVFEQYSNVHLLINNAGVTGPVNTAVMDADRNRPETLQRMSEGNITGSRLHNVYRRTLDHAMLPSQVAEIVIDGIKAERFYLLTHPEVRDLPAVRADAVKSDTYPEFDGNLARLVR